MTRPEFEAQMLRMAGLRFAPPTMDTHWEGLRAVPLETLKKAVSVAVITRSEFPSPVELRRDCDGVLGHPEAIPETGRDVPLDRPVALGQLPDGTPLPVANRMWVYYCDTCSDMGWQSVWCGEKPENHLPWVTTYVDCGRHGEHGPHEHVRQCACWASNPKLIRDRERLRKYAAEPVPVRAGRR